MKKFKTVPILTIIVNVLILTGCYKEVLVDITNPQDVQNNLRISQSQKEKGELPQSTTGNVGLQSIPSIGVTAGNKVILPILYSLSGNALKVFIQVEGAEGHISASITSCSATLNSGSYGYVSIDIPVNINDGSFRIRYLIQDGSGSYSNLVVTTINVNNDIKTCGNAQASGNDGLTFTTVDLGKVSGPVSIYYNTYTVPDRIDIYQGDEWIIGTGTNPRCPIPPLCNCSEATKEDGFVGESNHFNFDFDASKGRFITIVVSGCLDGGTQWNWSLINAPNCP